MRGAGLIGPLAAFFPLWWFHWLRLTFVFCQRMTEIRNARYWDFHKSSSFYVPNLTKLSKLFVDCAQTLCKCLLTLADYKIHQFLNWTQSKLQETKCCVSGLGRHREFSLYQTINVVCELIDLCRWGCLFLLYFANSEKSEVWRKANGVLTKDDTEIKHLIY